jgi:hypothetical protein
MDYAVSGYGRSHTITPLTDRAKARTPKPLDSVDKENAGKFMKSSQSAGYRFSGAELIDPKQQLVTNRYFIVGHEERLVPSGQDWGPLDTVWEVGDVMPGQTKDTGTEAIVVKIIHGRAAQKMMGCGIAFILRVRNTAVLN